MTKNALKPLINHLKTSKTSVIYYSIPSFRLTIFVNLPEQSGFFDEIIESEGKTADLLPMDHHPIRYAIAFFPRQRNKKTHATIKSEDKSYRRGPWV